MLGNTGGVAGLLAREVTAFGVCGLGEVKFSDPERRVACTG